MDLNGSTARAYREGRLLECQELLLRLPTMTDSEAVLAAELLNLLGKAADAAAAARRLVETKTLPSGLLARCTAVLADCRWYGGELSAGLELYQLAVRHAEISREIPIICRANTQLLERTCDGHWIRQFAAACFCGQAIRD